jgi:hypothetical protein
MKIYSCDQCKDKLDGKERFQIQVARGDVSWVSGVIIDLCQPCARSVALVLSESHEIDGMTRSAEPKK